MHSSFEQTFAITILTNIRNTFTRTKETPMVSKDLLEILCCPETKQDLTFIEGDSIRQFNEKIKTAHIKNRGGDEIKESIDAGLLRQDKKFLYPIRQDIPIMLIDEAIPYEAFEKK
jgi:uncharacterized protein YbaR (Trm112 family)